MKKNINQLVGSIILFLLLGATTSYAQKITISGVVKDSLGSPLDMANVVAINQETQVLDGFGITDAKGRYRISVHENSTYALKLSYIGFQPAERIITIEGKDVEQDFILKEQAENLDEVEVTYEIPVTIKGDTIVYNADSFNTGTEKKLEDVLENLPGVEVDEDGRIQVEGKSVSKVMVNGKDFFDGDTKLAVKNIPANALDKIEVLKNYSEVSQLSGVTNNQDNVALNIKLKEGKENFWFGELTAGVGLDDRYLAHPKLFYYSPKFSLNVLTDFNNIGEMPFTPRDYFNFTGGFRNLSSRGGTSFNVSSNDLGISTMQNNRAKSIETKFGAANFSYKVSDSWDLSGFFIYSDTGTELQTLTQKNYIATNEVEESTNDTDQSSRLTLAKLSSSYKPSTHFQFDYDVLLKASGQTDKVNILTVSSVTDNIVETKEQQPLSVNQNANIYYTLNDKNIFSFEGQYLYQNEDPFYNAIREQQPFSGVLPFDDSQSNYNINQERFVNTNKIESKLDYYWVTGDKSNINFTLGTIQSNQNFNSSIYQILDDESTLALEEDQYNNDVSFHFSDIYLSWHYKVILGKLTLNPGITAHTYKAKNEQLGTLVTDDMVNLVPDVFIMYQFKKSESLRLNYTITREFTDVNKLAEGFIFSNYNSLYQGNRALESALYHSASLNFFSFNMFNFQNIFGNLSYNRRIDAFKNGSSITGINQVNSTINSNLIDESLSGSANWQRTFGKIKTGLRSSLNYSKSNNLVNEQQRVSESFTQSYNASLGTRFTNAPNVELGYSYAVNDYDNGGLHTTYYTDSPSAKVDATFLKGFIFTADYSYNNYRDKAGTVKNQYDFMDTSLSYQKPDTKWEYSIQVTNLFNNQELNRDSFNDLFSSTSSYYIQPRYVMLKVKYEL